MVSTVSPVVMRDIHETRQGDNAPMMIEDVACAEASKQASKHSWARVTGVDACDCGPIYRYLTSNRRNVVNMWVLGEVIYREPSADQNTRASERPSELSAPCSARWILDEYVASMAIVAGLHMSVKLRPNRPPVQLVLTKPSRAESNGCLCVSVCRSAVCPCTLLSVCCESTAT